MSPAFRSSLRSLLQMLEAPFSLLQLLQVQFVLAAGLIPFGDLGPNQVEPLDEIVRRSPQPSPVVAIQRDVVARGQRCQLIVEFGDVVLNGLDAVPHPFHLVAGRTGCLRLG